MRLFLVLFLLLIPAARAAAEEGGLLSQVLEEVQGESGDDDRRKSRDRDDDDDDDCDNDTIYFADSGLLGTAFFYTVTSPWWIPREMFEPEECWDVDFSDYPYQHGYDGYLVVNPEEGDPFRDDDWAARFYTEYATDFDGLSRLGGRAIVDTSSRLGIDTEWNHWFEELGRGQDSLWTGDANVIVRFAQNDWIQMRSGIGVNWLSYEYGSEAGFNFTYGVDVFPAEPWVLESTLDVGKLGSADLLHIRGAVGIIHDRLEVHTGYDFYRIGDADLHGLNVGVSIWF